MHWRERERMAIYIPMSFVTEKRMADNVVSGALNLNVSCQVAGEFTVAPFHTMYTMLHEVWPHFSFSILVVLSFLVSFMVFTPCSTATIPILTHGSKSATGECQEGVASYYSK